MCNKHRGENNRKSLDQSKRLELERVKGREEETEITQFDV